MNGDSVAMDEVLTNSRQDLRRYAEFHCVVNDVEDAVQESLILVSRRLGDLRKQEAFASWLFRIVKRECNRLRRGWRLLVVCWTGSASPGNRNPPSSLENSIEICASVGVPLA